MRKDFHIGLSLSIFVASLFGVKCYFFRGKKWKWMNQIQSIYQNVILIPVVVFYPFVLASTLILNEGNHESLPSYPFAKVIYASVTILSRFIWYSSLVFTTIHTRLYSQILKTSLKKLKFLSSNFCKEEKENYFILMASILLILIYTVKLIVVIHRDPQIPDCSSFITHFFVSYGHSFPIVYCCFFFSVLDKLSSVAEELKNDSFCFTSSPVDLQMSKNLKLSRRKMNLNIKVFKKSFMKYYIITENLFEYFQVSISLIVLNHLTYILAKGAKMATVSDFHITGISTITINSYSLFLIFFLADILQLKVSRIEFVKKNMNKSEFLFSFFYRTIILIW